MGGNGSEREVSLKSGSALLQAYQRLGRNVTAIDIRSWRQLPMLLSTEKIEIAVLALHGLGGEDGMVQGLLETLGIPYTGSGVAASALCMNKIYSKRLFRDAGIPTPSWASVTVTRGQITQKDANLAALRPPFFIKPLDSGSSVGVARVGTDEDLDAALLQSAQSASTGTNSVKILVEEEVAGVEVTLAVLNAQPLPLIEIQPETGFYSYDNKYTPGKTQYRIPPVHLPASVREPIEAMGIKAGEVTGCRGLYRADFMVDPDNRPWILEINTIPGMTETSLAPKAAAAAGISFDQLAEHILASAHIESCCVEA